MNMQKQSQLKGEERERERGESNTGRNWQIGIREKETRRQS
jgi:hypothetical protein